MSQKDKGLDRPFRLEYSVLFLAILFVLSFFMLQYNKAGKLTPIDEGTDYPIYVNISGEVQNPGIVELKSGATLNDGITACGGIVGNSTPIEENRILKNGENIVVSSPSFGEEPRININTATPEELKTLPNIGDKTAGSILEYRTENNGFRTLEDLLFVSGIGEKTLQKLMPYITLE